MSYDIIILMSVPMVCLAFVMAVSMPETFIEPLKATLLGLYMVLKR